MSGAYSLFRTPRPAHRPDPKPNFWFTNKSFMKMIPTSPRAQQRTRNREKCQRFRHLARRTARSALIPPAPCLQGPPKIPRVAFCSTIGPLGPYPSHSRPFFVSFSSLRRSKKYKKGFNGPPKKQHRRCRKLFLHTKTNIVACGR